ncbi:hypothetical protein HR10_03380 [Porphyromonas gulae]|nr:hypothetical protein HR10_03380 [Porphyromonas gulae]
MQLFSCYLTQNVVRMLSSGMENHSDTSKVALTRATFRSRANEKVPFCEEKDSPYFLYLPLKIILRFHCLVFGYKGKEVATIKNNKGCITSNTPLSIGKIRQ